MPGAANKGYTEVLVDRTRRRSSATWTPDCWRALKIDQQNEVLLTEN